MSTHRVRFVLNGAPRDLAVAADRLLIDVLRDDCGATGTKLGCGVGVCGACSVLVDGALLSACLLPAIFVDGRRVTTVEGLAEDAEAPGRLAEDAEALGRGAERAATLTKLQDAFVRDGGFQCGICTPGQLIAATALLAERPRPEEREIRTWMMGNLCRCTGYYGIVRAIQRAAEASPEAEPAPLP